MNEPLPTDIGGLQKLEPFVIVRRGDIWVGAGRPEYRCMSAVGMTVENAEAAWPTLGRIYRKMPVPQHLDKPAAAALAKTISESVAISSHLAIEYIPQDDKRRKGAPMFRGLLGYFPAALFAVAEHSRESNDKHNPGEELHWARGKSSDHADCIVRHLIDAGKRGTPGRLYHLRALAWRSLAALQEECEANGAAPGVNARF